MRKASLTLCCVIVVSTIWVLPCFAEGPAKFYEQDYAHTPFQDDKNKYKPKKGKSATAKAAAAASGVVVEKDASTERPRSRVGSNPRDPSNVMDDTQGNPILSIGLIVDAADNKAIREVTQSLISVLDEHDILAGDIYTLSSPAMLGHKDLIHLTSRGGSLSSGKELPKRYSEVKLSPTFLIETGDGEVILEAVSDLSRFINSKGEFLDDPNPLQARTKAAPRAKPF